MTAPAPRREALTRRSAAAGAVHVRLMGEPADVAALAALMVGLDWTGRIEITAMDGPYANRREPGNRVYVTARVPGTAGAS